MVGNTWSKIAPIRTLKYFLEDASKHKSRVHQLDFIEAFLQENVKHKVFVKLGSRYGEFILEYSNYFERPLRPKKSIYGMTNSVNLSYDELNNCLIDEALFKFHNVKCTYIKSIHHMDTS